MALQNTAALPFFSGDGPVRELLRCYDWSKSALGEPGLWPQSLRTILALTLNTQTPIFFCWGPDLNFLYNDAYIEILGVKHPAALGRPFRDVWAEVWNDVEPLVAKTLAGQALHHEDMPFTITRNNSAEQIWVSFSYSPLHDETGAVAGLFCALNETTRRILAERGRIEETERLRRLFQQAPSMIAVVRGAEHVYEIANNAYLNLIGRGDVVGRRVWDVVPELGAQGFISLLDEVYTTGKPHLGRAVPIWLDKGNGEGRAEYFIDFIYQPIFDPDGNVTGIFGEGIDVTDTVRALAALQASEARLRMATDAAELAIWTWDLEAHEVTWENDRPYEIFGLPTSQAPITAAQFTSDFLLPEDTAAFQQATAVCLESRRDLYFQGRFYPYGSREPRWIELKGRFEAVDDRSTTKILGTAADITNHKRNEEQAQRAASVAMAAAEANAKFRTFFDQGSYFAGVLTLDGTLVEANLLSLEACGFAREDVIGKKFWDGGWWNRSPALVERVRNGCAQAAQGQQFRLECDYFTADGTKRFAELILTPATDEAGRVLFIASTGKDITDRTKMEARLRLLDSLNQATRDAVDPKVIMATTTQLLGEYLQVTRCAYADLEADNDRFTIRHDWTTDGAVSTVGVYSLDLFGPRAAKGLRNGHTVAIDDVDRELPPGEGADMFNAIGIKAVVCCPLVKQGRLLALMAIHQNAPRNWTHDDLELLEEVVERSWAHIERVRAMEVLQKNESHLLSLFEQTTAGIAESDLSGRLTRVNDRYCEILGRNSTELLGMFMQDLTHSDDLDDNLPLFRNLIMNGTPFSLEKRYLRPDGSSVWVNTTVSPIRAPNQGRPESVLAVVLDISEHKLAQQALHDETRILELLNRSGQALASTLDLNTLLQTVTDSGRALTGAEFGAFFYNGNDENGDAYMLYTLSGAPKEAFDQFGHPRATAVFKPTFEGEPPIRSDDITKDSRYGKMSPHYGMPKGHLPVRSYLAAPVISRTGDVIGGLFFGHSQVAVFTERAERLVTGLASQAAMAIDNARLYDLAQKAANERQALLANERTARAEAERLSRSKDEFLAMLAHELRNPLAPVSAASEILRLASHDPERVRQVSEIISRQINHFTRLIDDLMDVSRVTRGLIQLETKPVDLKSVISTAIEQIRPMIEARQHSLTSRMDADHAVVNGDRTRLVQVIANLLANAAKYTPPHGDITLKIEADREHARIVVNDNGIGMDDLLLPHVFDLFTQGSRGLDRSQGGLGIGLALVKAIVTLHQGEVKACSNGIGQGSTFTISIPLIRAEIHPPQEVERDKEARDLSILVVDDNVDAANALAILLKATGYKVKVAANATEAKRIAETDLFDVFILDIGLPDMTGYELAMALRRRPILEGKTYIALTGYGQPQDRQLSKEAGFAHHFVKPVNHLQLFKVLADTKSTSVRA